MESQKLAGYLALYHCPGIGPVKLRQWLESGPIPISELPGSTRSELLNHGFSEDQAEALLQPSVSPEATLEWLEADENHRLLSIEDTDYPPLLRELNDAPPLLFCKGRSELLQQPQLAMVGSRHCTPGGAKTAYEFSSLLSQAGLTITSGMALGIDTQAHQAALDQGGATVAVVGTGIDRIYPATNRQLAHAIAAEGLMVSEFPLGTPPLSQNFPRRNRIISGLSIGTLVIEAAARSGSLITARNSAEQGREVFAVPGSIHNPLVKGCHQLIRDGAKLVDQASDIIDDVASLLGYVASQANTESSSSMELAADYQQLLDSMGFDPVSFDDLAERSGLTIEQLSSMLLILELNDYIRTAPGGLYLRC